MELLTFENWYQEAMHCRSLEADELLNVRWAYDDPNPKVTENVLSLHCVFSLEHDFSLECILSLECVLPLECVLSLECCAVSVGRCESKGARHDPRNLQKFLRVTDRNEVCYSQKF